MANAENEDQAYKKKRDGKKLPNFFYLPESLKLQNKRIYFKNHYYYRLAYFLLIFTNFCFIKCIKNKTFFLLILNKSITTRLKKNQHGLLTPPLKHTPV